MEKPLESSYIRVIRGLGHPKNPRNGHNIIFLYIIFNKEFYILTRKIIKLNIINESGNNYPEIINLNIELNYDHS